MFAWMAIAISPLGSVLQDDLSRISPERTARISPRGTRPWMRAPVQLACKQIEWILVRKISCAPVEKRFHVDSESGQVAAPDIVRTRAMPHFPPTPTFFAQAVSQPVRAAFLSRPAARQYPSKAGFSLNIVYIGSSSYSYGHDGSKNEAAGPE